MNKMTNKEYLVDITLKTLQVSSRQVHGPCKIMCEIHYGDGDSYLRIKMQPALKNGLASFYEERIRIPYSSEIALVFKMFKVKKQIFLGHYSIETEKYLQEKKYSLKMKEKLEEADAWVDFQVKIIDKQLFCEEESDDLDDQELFPTAKSNYSEGQKSKAQISDYKAKSEYNQPFVIIKRQQSMQPPLLPQEFNKLLMTVQEILQKHTIMSIKQERIQYLQENSGRTPKSSTIFRLQNDLEKLKKNRKVNSMILWCVVGLLGFFIGFMIKS